MLCQNCKKNEATMHLKRIVNGTSSQEHLCADCARSLGYGDAFSGLGMSFGDILGDIFGKGEIAGAGSSLKCPMCGKTFDEIIASGTVGCAECYATFYEKLLPSLRKIHGRAAHVGKSPVKTNDVAALLDELNEKMRTAVSEQNFELAAQLRDKISALSDEGADL